MGVERRGSTVSAQQRRRTEKQVLDNANTQERTDDGGHNVRHGQKQYFASWIVDTRAT